MVVNVIIQVKILVRNNFRLQKKCKKQSRTDTVILDSDSTCTGARSDIADPGTNTSSNSASLNKNFRLHDGQQEAVIVAEINPWLNGDSAHRDLQQTNSISNMAASDTISAGTNTSEINTDSDFTAPDSISTGSDPQQPAATISNSILSSDAVSIGSRSYPQQVNSSGSGYSSIGSHFYRL